MTSNQIIAQILGVLVIIICIIMPQMKTKTSLIFCNLIATGLIVVSSILGGAYTGAATAVVSTIRSFMLYLYSRKELRAPAWTLIAFVVANTIAVFCTWTGWASALLLLIAFNIYGQWQENLKVTRICILVVTAACAVYNIIAVMYALVLNEVLQHISAIMALYRFRKKEL